jgi:hypothetical protein
MSCELEYVILECRDEERPVRERAFQELLNDLDI